MAAPALISTVVHPERQVGERAIGIVDLTPDAVDALIPTLLRTRQISTADEVEVTDPACVDLFRVAVVDVDSVEPRELKVFLAQMLRKRYPRVFRPQPREILRCPAVLHDLDDDLGWVLDPETAGRVQAQVTPVPSDGTRLWLYHNAAIWQSDVPDSLDAFTSSKYPTDELARAVLLAVPPTDLDRTIRLLAPAFPHVVGPFLSRGAHFHSGTLRTAPHLAPATTASLLASGDAALRQHVILSLGSGRQPREPREPRGPRKLQREARRL